MSLARISRKEFMNRLLSNIEIVCGARRVFKYSMLAIKIATPERQYIYLLDKYIVLEITIFQENWKHRW